MTGKTNKQKGFTLLFASLVGSLLLALGIATFNIILRELNLSSSARESRAAFYAAASGWECAFYHDRKRPAVFATSTNSSPAASIQCANQTISIIYSTFPFSSISTFRVQLDGDACSDITITKDDNDNKDKISKTLIESRGKNDCSTNPNPNRVERAIRPPD